MNCAASAGGTIQSFYCGPVRCQLLAGRRDGMGRCRHKFRLRDIAGENGAAPGCGIRRTLARESRHIVPFRLSGTTSRAADRFLRFHRVKRAVRRPDWPSDETMGDSAGGPGLRRCFVDGEAKCGLTNGWSF
jgi:hypothetical protein